MDGRDFRPKQAPALPSPRFSPPGALGSPFVLPLACLDVARGLGGPGLAAMPSERAGLPRDDRIQGTRCRSRALKLMNRLPRKIEPQIRWEEPHSMRL